MMFLSSYVQQQISALLNPQLRRCPKVVSQFQFIIFVCIEVVR